MRNLRFGQLIVLGLVLVGCRGAPPETLTSLEVAKFVASGSAVEEVRLPHARASAPGERAVEYAFSLPAKHPEGIGVFVTVSAAPFAAFVNAAPVFQNGDSRSPSVPHTSWRASSVFRVSPLLLADGQNELVLHVFDRPGSGGRLGTVLVGPPDVVERWAMREAVVHHFVPLLIGAVLIGVGLISLGLWRGQRDGYLFLLLACGTLLWGCQALIQQFPSRIVPLPHYSVLIISLYIWYPMLLSVFFLRFAYYRSRLYEAGAALLVASAAPVLYAGVATGQFATVSMVLRGAALVGITVALAAVIRYALRERGVQAMLLLGAGALCVGFAVRDYVVSLGPGSGGRELWLTGYSGLGLIVLAGWILVERVHVAYAASEASKAALESRVQAANRELERRLQQVQAAREQAEQASRAKSRFFAAASHDLRQPLHSLGLFAAALEGHVFSRDARDLVSRIGESIESLESLFNELLDLSRLDAGAVAVHPRNFALQEVFDRLALEFHGEAVERHLRMRFVPTSLAVRTDPVLLERVLANLVSNALRYTREGGVVIGARHRGLEVWLDVVDTGIGIPAEKQRQVFDEFFQIGNPGRDRRRGLGLGLAIVRRLVALMGHPLTLQSVPGKGSRFRLTLLRAHRADPLVAAQQDPGIEAFAGRRALLVEDDPDIRLATTRLLGQWGMTVMECRSASDVERVLEDGFRPDIALVDLRLESIDDGIDVVDALRARLQPDLPALLLSGDTGAAELTRVKESGVPLLTKPVSPARLKSALHAYLAGRPPVGPDVARAA